MSQTIPTVVFDTKPYDREALQRASAGGDIEWRFMECRLSVETAAAATGAQAVCTFVNDRVDRACLEALAKLGVNHVALRCAGFNSIDLAAAQELGITATRDGRIKKGDLVLMEALGGGLTWGAALVRV